MKKLIKLISAMGLAVSFLICLLGFAILCLSKFPASEVSSEAGKLGLGLGLYALFNFICWLAVIIVARRVG